MSLSRFVRIQFNVVSGLKSTGGLLFNGILADGTLELLIREEIAELTGPAATLAYDGEGHVTIIPATTERTPPAPIPLALADPEAATRFRHLLADRRSPHATT